MKVEVLGIYQTKFGDLWEKSLKDLITEASFGAIQDGNLKREDIDAIFVGNMLAAKTSNQEHLGALVSEILGINVPATRVEAACASGGLALFNAINAIESGLYKTALVLGVEKMTDLSPAEITTGLIEAGSFEKEGKNGLTFPSLYALISRVYMEKYFLREEDLALIPVKNHFHARLNNKAQFPFEISVDQVMKSPYVADPLKLLDCSPISDGAAAIIISNIKKKKEKRKKKDVYIIGSAVATDTVALQDRDDFTSLKATKIAARKAYKMAGVEPKDIDIAEVHDCFSIAEILAMEDLGFCKKGEAIKMIKKEETKLGGKLPINTSGGLKACGHPVGATGIKQICEIVTHLRGEAGERQVKDARVGLTHNVGGSGGTAVVHILKS